MSVKRRRGPISKFVKTLCINLCLSGGSEIEFREGLKKLVQYYGYLGNIRFHDIGTAIQKWAKEYCKDDMERIWTLADGADTRIRKDWEDYQKRFLRV